MGKSDYLEAQFLRWVTGQTNNLGTVPTPYLGLYTVAPTDAGGGTEVSGGGYARVNATGKFAVPTAGEVANTANIQFATPSSSWGDVVAVGLFDAVTDGNLLKYVALAVPKTIDVGDPANFAIGALIFRED